MIIETSKPGNLQIWDEEGVLMAQMSIQEQVLLDANNWGQGLFWVEFEDSRGRKKVFQLQVFK